MYLNTLFLLISNGIKQRFLCQYVDTSEAERIMQCFAVKTDEAKLGRYIQL